ncbi:hypothetical protein PIB30_056709 [Stylosanthes scabra]|uniref:Uncharacterized protein n=1 Tax=Stylosanthes scabra TaxID=79078 RepID=A0ABU6TJA1_9FABA|nr:hypothetical protein [Stylosanthes scabra]
MRTHPTRIGTHPAPIKGNPHLSFSLVFFILSSISTLKMAPRKVYPPPSRFSRRLAALRARRARDEAAPANAAPHEDEVIEISSDSSLEQVPEYVPGEGAENEQDDEEVPDYVPSAEPMEEEEDSEEDPEEEPDEDPEEDPEEEPEEDPEEDPEEEPQEEQPEAMEQEEEEEGQEIAFG